MLLKCVGISIFPLRCEVLRILSLVLFIFWTFLLPYGSSKGGGLLATPLFRYNLENFSVRWYRHFLGGGGRENSNFFVTDNPLPFGITPSLSLSLFGRSHLSLTEAWTVPDSCTHLSHCVFSHLQPDRIERWRSGITRALF